jgi:prolipoprotein diacylglyceryltransferase
MTSLSVITISLDPNLHLGPVTLAWHGLTIAIGILVGGLAAGRFARERGLEREPLYTIGMLLAIGGIVGGRLFYVLEHGGPLLGTRGFTFDGGVILAAALIAVYVWRQRLGARYLDVVAVGLPLGVAVGRIGDVINGEHYGPRTTSSSRCATPTPTRSPRTPHSPTTTAGSTRSSWGPPSSPSCGRCATAYAGSETSPGSCSACSQSGASSSSSCAPTARSSRSG